MKKKILKRFLRSAPVQNMLSLLIAGYIRFVYFTSRKKMDFDPLAVPYVTGDMPAIFSFWHGNLLMIAPVCPKVKTHVLISTHHDGDIIARTVKRFGIQAIRGSSRHGGRQAAVQAIRVLKDGGRIAITPDGPKGPRLKIQEGVITLANAASVPIIPVACSSTHHRLLGSWDKFILVFPFGSLHYRVGAPMVNPSSQTLEAFMLEQSLER